MINNNQAEELNYALDAINCAGGFTTVAREFDISYPAVRKWAEQKRIPPERILRVCQMGNNTITPHQLNPLIYPEDFAA